MKTLPPFLRLWFLLFFAAFFAAFLFAPPPVMAGEDDPLRVENVVLTTAAERLSNLIEGSEKLSTTGFVFYSEDHGWGWGGRTTFSLGERNRAHVDVWSPDWGDQNSAESYVFSWFEHDFGLLSETNFDPFVAIGVGGSLDAGAFGGGVAAGIRWRPGPDSRFHVGVQAALVNLDGDPSAVFGAGIGMRF